jgi:hypothetical protein
MEPDGIDYFRDMTVTQKSRRNRRQMWKTRFLRMMAYALIVAGVPLLADTTWIMFSRYGVAEGCLHVFLLLVSAGLGYLVPRVLRRSLDSTQ